MGGHALSVDSVRLSAVNYLNVVVLISEILTSKLPNLKFAVIPAYFQKPDFGDMDILFSSERYNPHGVADVLKATEVVRNGDVTSIGFAIGTAVFQVDLISTPKECFDFSLSYFGFNDLGNLLGRVAHKLGFKFGHKGLMYVIRDPNKPTHVIKEINITNSFKDALEFCGYSFEEYKKGEAGGFQTLEDIFKYVVSTPYFNKEIFLLDNRNAKARVRDSKRKTYMDFLKWIEDKDFNSFDWSSKEELRLKALSDALMKFPEFKEEYFNTIASYKRSEAVAKKFNGALVTKLTGRTGKDIGIFIRAFKNSFEDFDTFVLNSDNLEYNIKNFKVS